MIHVEQIKIREFRGIRNLTINFKGENFAICGPNGTGKSGVVDALEFALTGSISRLSGRGTGGISVKEHAPHVDCRNSPDKARVILSVSIPSLSKKATIERSVRNPLVPVITPDDPDILNVLNQVSIHPEFALSRRELIRYVISAPGDRAKEVQALLRLNEIEELRTIFQKIANASQKEIPLLQRERQRAEEQLLRALDISDLNQKKLLEAVNLRRLLLGLGPITVLTLTTSLRDGLVTTAPAAQPNRIPKIQALADVKKLSETLTRITGAKTVALCESAIEKLTALGADSRALNDVTREQFLQSALTFIDDEKCQCPVCDTPWDSTELKGIVSSKLRCFEEVRRKRTIIETELEPLCELMEELSGALEIVEKYGAALVPPVDTKVIKT